MPLCLSYMITCLLQKLSSNWQWFICLYHVHIISYDYLACSMHSMFQWKHRSTKYTQAFNWILETENDILAYILALCWHILLKWTPQSVPWLFAHTPPLNKWSPKCASSNSIRPCKQVNVFVSKCIGRLCSLCVCTFNTGAHRASLQYSIAWLVFPSLPSRCRFMKRRSKTTN